MKIVQVKSTGKSPPVKVDLETWCRICNALTTLPDNTPQRVADVAEKRHDQLKQAYVELRRLKNTKGPGP